MKFQEISILVITDTIPRSILYAFILPREISILATTQKFIHPTTLKKGFNKFPIPTKASMIDAVRRQEERAIQTRRTVFRLTSTTADEPIM